MSNSLEEETDFARIVALWNEGVIARGELFGRLIEEGVRTGLDEAVNAVPADLRLEFEEALDEYGPEHGPPENYFMVRGGVLVASREALDRLHARWDAEEARWKQEIIPAVRSWLVQKRQSP